MACKVDGNNVAKILEYWFDGTKIWTEKIAVTNNQPVHTHPITIEDGYLTHGYHTVQF